MEAKTNIKLKARPLELAEANDFVEKLHRHHKAVHRDKFRIGCITEDGQLHGVVQLARPVSRMLDDGNTIEIVRLATDGTRNACSFLYGKAARIAREMGYKKIITYILKSEPGTSLKAAGFKLDDDDCGGTDWNRPSRPRTNDGKYPAEKKQRWAIEYK